MSTRFHIDAAETDAKRVALEQIAYNTVGNMPHPEKSRVLIFAGPTAFEVSMLRDYSVQDSNLIVVDENERVLNRAVDRRKIKGATLFPHVFNVENVRNAGNIKKLNVVHLDMLATLDSPQLQEAIKALTVSKVLAPKARIAITFIRGRDPESFKLTKSKYRGNRVELLRDKVEKTLKRKTEIVAFQNYKNGPSGKFPMCWAVFQIN